MTTYNSALPSPALVELVADLSRELTAEERYRRLLAALRRIFPCDAAALLQLQGDTPSAPQFLKPVAVDGLSEDTLGRRFEVASQPRLARILQSREPVRFENSDLPDPYDGLVDGGGHSVPVHDCMGATLYIDERPWGVLTFDALAPDAFDAIEPAALRAFISLAEASVKAALTIDALRQRAEREHQVNRALLADREQRELIGKSSAMQRLRHEIGVVATSDLTVLILGETGVGKELVAQQLHAGSLRANELLVHVNCAALPETLADSELFGHRKGAFTGALQDRSGKFELADGGTLLLDEVGELPLSIQAKLLRVLQSGEIQRPGSDRPLHANVRVLAATNRDLKQEVAMGRFRADLYHRLSVFPLWVPPLRERGRDVLALAGFFLEDNQRRLGVRSLCLSPAAKQALLNYDWPGNVRELEHLLSRAALLAVAQQGRSPRWITIDAPQLGLDDKRVSTVDTTAEMAMLDPVLSLQEATRQFQTQWLQQALVRSDNNLALAAKSAGMDRGNFYRLLKRMGLR
jgi:anaerobic nitric oxide reductase transcription regulator